MTPRFQFDPPQSSSLSLSYPASGIMLVTISRPAAMNSLPYPAHYEADAIFSWYDNEPSLRVAIITGSGTKAFCAGQDLIELNNAKSAPSFSSDPTGRGGRGHPPSGFAGISRRKGKKPILAAVNGCVFYSCLLQSPGFWGKAGKWRNKARSLVRRNGN